MPVIDSLKTASSFANEIHANKINQYEEKKNAGISFVCLLLPLA